MYQPTSQETVVNETVEPVKKVYDNTAKEFKNDLTEEDKARVLEYATNAVKDTLGLPVLTVNDLTHLGMVGHGSIKNRAKSTSSAREIVFAIINGTRKNSEPSEQRVKDYISGLSPEDKAKLLAELTNQH